MYKQQTQGATPLLADNDIFLWGIFIFNEFYCNFYLVKDVYIFVSSDSSKSVIASDSIALKIGRG